MSVEAGIKVFVDSHKKTDRYNGVYFGFVDEKGNLDNWRGAACFGELRYERCRLNNPKYMIVGVQRCTYIRYKTPTEEDIIQYLDFMTNHSIFSDIFVTKNGEEIYDKKYLLLRTDVPANLMIGAGIVNRFYSEEDKSPYFNVFSHLVKNLGVDPCKAYVFSFFFKSGYVKSSNPSFYPVFASTTYGHAEAAPSHAKKQYLQNYYFGNPQIEDENFNTKLKYNGSDIHRTWGECDYYGNQSENLKFTLSLKPKDGEGKIDLNIFYKNKSGQGYLIKSDEDLLNIFNQFFEWLEN